MADESAHRRRVEDVIDFLGLSPYRHQAAGHLPYGVQKRVELGRALAAEPKLILLDEPMAGMNLEETEDMAPYQNKIDTLRGAHRNLLGFYPVLDVTEVEAWCVGDTWP